MLCSVGKRWVSLSARRAWIEICLSCPDSVSYQVALRKESVDRNNTESANIRACIVALRKESVDRNNNKKKGIKDAQVALRKESVDRNHADIFFPLLCCCRSPQGERG